MCICKDTGDSCASHLHIPVCTSSPSHCAAILSVEYDTSTVILDNLAHHQVDQTFNDFLMKPEMGKMLNH